MIRVTHLKDLSTGVLPQNKKNQQLLFTKQQMFVHKITKEENVVL